jgi:hypothetical protein
MIYSFILLVFCFIATARGHNIWFSSVRDTNFFAPAIVTQMQAQFLPQSQPFSPALVPQFAGQPMYPPYSVPQQGIPFQAAPMQQMPFQNSPAPFMTPQSNGSPYPVQGTFPTPPPQQQQQPPPLQV